MFFYSVVFLTHVTFLSFLQKKTYDEQKFDSKKVHGPVASDTNAAKSSHHVSIHAGMIKK